MARYAERTSVSVKQTKAEIEDLVERYGARRFVSGWEDERAVIMFEMHNRRIRLDLPLPKRTDKAITHTPTGLRRTEGSEQDAYDQEVRRRWRALLLVIKAKLEAVATGITDFETEFLAHIVLPSGETYGAWAIPQIDEAYRTGQMPPMLPHNAAPILLPPARDG